MQTQPVFDTKPLLRPAQVEEAKAEIATLEKQMTSPSIEDKGEVHKRLMRVRKTFESQVPHPPASGEEEGRMVAREKQLLSEILVGMPSQEEMRKAPPGAVDKHMAWEKRNKMKIAEWKNLRLRLNPGEREAANLERNRPVTSTLNMDNAYIPGKQFFMPETAGKSVVFSDEQLVFLRSMNPALADMLGLMSNPQREQVKEAISGIGLTASAASIAGKIGVERREAAKKAKRVLSEEHKRKLKEGRERAAAKKAA